MGFYAEMAATATEMLREFGAAATLRSITQGAYDPATGTAAQIVVSQPATAAVFDYALKFINGSVIRQGDKQAYLAVSGIRPKIGDVLLWGDVEYAVVSFKPLAPALVEVLWELQLRGGAA